MENTETVTITKTANGYQLTVQHDQSGSAYGCDLSEAAYEQLRLHLVVGRSEQLADHPRTDFEKGYTKGWCEGFNSGKQYKG
jgi:hypothetical protein